MPTPKIHSTSMDVRTIGEALPSPYRHHRRPKPQSKPMPTSLPPCFEDVWRRRHSTNIAHRRERATLEAVASTIPVDTAALATQSVAAVYLAALVLSLQRLVSTTSPSTHMSEAHLDADKSLSRKERKKLRRQQRQAEDDVQELPAVAALADNLRGEAEETTMNIDVADGTRHVDASTTEDTELIANLVGLIGMAAAGSSQAVLNAKCDAVLQAVMAAYIHTAGAPVVSRYTSSVFATVLAVLDSSSWSKPVVQRSYLYLLKQTCDTDPRSRRRARDALEMLLHSSRAAVVRAKTSFSAASHFVSELKTQASALDDDLNGDTVLEAAPNPALFVYLLTSVEKFAVFLSPPDAARVCKELVLISVKTIPKITPFALLAVSSLFNHKREVQADDPEGTEPKVFLPQGDLGKLLQALLGLELAADCARETVVAYNTCIANGAESFAACHLFSSPSDEYIFRPVKKLFDSLNPANGRTEVTRAVCGSLQNLLAQRWFQSRAAILSLLCTFTTNAYRLLWPETKPILKRYLENQLTAGNLKVKDQVTDLARTVVAAREKALQSNDRKTQDMANGVILSLIRGGGVECLLAVCKIQYDKKKHVTNAWLLPMLREGLCGAPLSLFWTRLVPVANRLKEVKDAELQKRPIEAMNIGGCIAQIWGLLPGFCNKPSDLGQDGAFNTAFKAIHHCISSSDQPVMCAVGFAALRQLSISVLALNRDDPVTEARKRSFGSRLKKLFPVLVTVTEGTSDSGRSLVLEAMTASCRAVGDSSLVSTMLRKSIRRLLELQVVRTKHRSSISDAMEDSPEQIVRQQHAAADLAIAITESRVVANDAAELSFLEKAMSPFFLDTKESSLQKKAYRATTLLIASGSMSNVKTDLQAFARNTAVAGGSVAPGAKAVRQGLLTALVNQHLHLTASEEKVELLQLLTDLFLSEIVLGTRDSSEKTRSASFETLVTMARGWNSTSTGNDTDGLRKFFLAVAAGLGGKTVSMLSASLTSLGRLMYDFQGEVSGSQELSSDVDSLFASVITEANENVKMTSENEDGEMTPYQRLVHPGPVAILLRHNAPEVQKSALGVVKIATKVLSHPPTRLTQILPGILPGLVHAAARSKKQETRIRVRVILERLLRKCGREVLEANFPQEHLKLLAAVRKKYSRDLIKKHAAKEKRRERMGAQNEKEKILQAQSESEDSDELGIDDSDSDVERELLDGDEMIASRKNTAEKLEGPLHVKERNGDVMDLLDSKNNHAIMTESELRQVQIAKNEQKRIHRKRKDDSIKYTDDGRPIFVESDEGSAEAEKGSITDHEYGGGDSGFESDQAKRTTNASRKRQRKESAAADRQSKKMKGSFGDEYRSRKGQGDVKRQGRPDPFAYIPLGVGMVNSRVRGKGGKLDSGLRRVAGSKGQKKKGGRVGVPAKR